ncbi:MAG: hypothetical protein ABIO70_01145 [Pseudomonadota bacterium]
MTPSPPVLIATSLVCGLLLAVAGWGALDHRRIERRLARILRIARRELDSLTGRPTQAGDDAVRDVLARALLGAPAALDAWHAFRATLVSVGGRPRRTRSAAEFFDIDVHIYEQARTMRGGPPAFLRRHLPQWLAGVGVLSSLALLGLLASGFDWGALIDTNSMSVAATALYHAAWPGLLPMVLGIALAFWSHADTRDAALGASRELQQLCRSLDLQFRHVSTEELLARILRAVEAARPRSAA